MIKEIENICVDCDDVLVDFHTPLREWHNAIYGTNLKHEDFISYRFHEIWGGTGEEAIKKVNEFQHSEYGKKLLPIQGTVESIDILLQRGKKLFLTTSRPLSSKGDTEKLLETYFKDKFLDVFYSSNHYTKAKNSGKSKGEICKKLNASLIDDSLDYVKQVALMGLRAILFGDYPWNQNGTLPEGVSRAENWKRTLEILT
jgi:uncharacterized HAD superfamily protein